MATALFSATGVLGFVSFRSGVPWLDSNGREIDAHGGGLLLEGGRYFWYGSRRRGFPCDADGCTDGGVNAYSSADLYTWRYEGNLVRSFNASSTQNGLDLERPKVIKCAGTGRFVMWVRGTGRHNTPQLLATLSADSPLGPFVWHNTSGTDNPFRTVAQGLPAYPPGYQYADATLYQDQISGKAFVYWRTRVNPQHTGFRAMELTADCLDVDPKSDTQLFTTPNREAPAVFWYDNRYYLWVSGTMGWSPTQMFLYTSSTPLGPFNQSELEKPIPGPGQPGNRPPEQPGLWAFGSQSTYILPNPMYTKGSNLPQFIYMADRWHPESFEFGTYVWLPLFIDPLNSSRVRVVWFDNWTLDNVTSPFGLGEGRDAVFT